MAAVQDSDKYYLEREEVIDDVHDDYEYEEVPVDEEFVAAEVEEDLDAAVRTVREASEDVDAAGARDLGAKPSLVQKPEVVDDFVRNFLVRMGMSRTLDCFQTEWYELQQRGLLHEEDIGVVPDIYSRNSDLDSEVKFLKTEVVKFRNAALKAKETYVKLRKERDYHRMHHKRVVQEKNKLIDDLKRLKRHYAQYEPTLQTLRSKYEVAMKEKMLARLERDRAVGQASGLQSTLKSAENLKSNSSIRGGTADAGSGAQRPRYMVDERGMGPTQRTLLEMRKRVESSQDVGEYPKDFKRHPKDSEFPLDTGVNPELAKKGPPGHLTRTGGFRLSNTFTHHAQPVSGLALHPRKQILATTSDDHTWKIWFVPSGEIILSGEGHTEWVSDCDFHPSGSTLATTSGDTTVKVWSLSEPTCKHTFTDHTLAVWSCSWHTCGDFLATASMDNTAKIWDLNSLRCRYTLRGHADSVNCVEFLPYSNTLVTCSADKTLSLWDARVGICAQSYFGHMNSVNSVTFNARGDTLASCDSMGSVRLWDVRKIATIMEINVGPHPANKVAFDPTGTILAIASNDGTIKMYELANGTTIPLIGHEDAVQCVLFDRSGEFLVSGGSDNTVRIWS
ncbi:sperm-associated antigen 16 protein-like isoform X2 [Babylonia areolata]|uniref:sperm-associated antigen 16 protein-like isoform X2 n=1 Tax=Babylonia areolata TaxID=304850 RepID=UPI003FD0C1C2